MSKKAVWIWVTERWLLLIFLMGIVLLSGLTVWKGLGLSTTGAVIAALVAGTVALSINQTVHQRQRDESATRLRERREDAYGQVIAHLLASFTGGSSVTEFHIRGIIASWASPEFLDAYAAWRQSITGLATDGMSVHVPPDRKPAIQVALARVALAARADLGLATGEEISVEEMAAALFDDYVEDPRSA